MAGDPSGPWRLQLVRADLSVLSGALSGGRGSGKREAGEEQGGLIELGGIAGEAHGERLRQQGACRGLDIRAAKFVSRLSEFQASEFQTKDQMLQWMDEVRGERGTEGGDGKGAPPPGGRELACLAKGRTNWRLTWCW